MFIVVKFNECCRSSMYHNRPQNPFINVVVNDNKMLTMRC